MTCVFCRPGFENQLPRKDGFGGWVRCRKGWYNQIEAQAVLAPEQYTVGHSLLILNRHFEDWSFCDATEWRQAFSDAIYFCICHLKEILGAPRIYVASLCDGVQHLHAHLIPRYEQDWPGGFHWLGELEHNYEQTEFWQKSDEERATILEELARRLKI